MKKGTKIIVLKGARVFFPQIQGQLSGTMELDRDIEGIVTTVYPDGTPNEIDFANDITVHSGLNWVKGKDYEIWDEVNPTAGRRRHVERCSNQATARGGRTP